MKTPQIVVIALAFVLGAGVMAAVSFNSGDDSQKELEKKLATAEVRIKELEAEKPGPGKIATRIEDTGDKPLRSAIPQPSEKEKDEVDEDASPEEKIAQLLNSKEARNLIKGFAGAMSGRADQFIGREIEKYRKQFDLSDAQAESIKNRMAAMVEENTKKFQSELDDENKSFQDIMQSQGQFWQENETEIESMLSEELNEDQFDQFKQVQLTEKTQRVQRSADYELKQMDESLDLSDAQEDQVFTILVQESPEYDPAMAIEGVETGLAPEATADDVTKDEAIRSVLTTEQAATYDTKQESGGFGQRRRNPWGGGGR